MEFGDRGHHLAQRREEDEEQGAELDQARHGQRPRSDPMGAREDHDDGGELKADVGDRSDDGLGLGDFQAGLPGGLDLFVQAGRFGGGGVGGPDRADGRHVALDTRCQLAQLVLGRQTGPLDYAAYHGDQDAQQYDERYSGAQQDGVDDEHDDSGAQNERDAGGAGHEDLEEARPQTGRVAGHPADQVTGAAFVVLLDLQAQEVPAELPPGVVDDRLAHLLQIVVLEHRGHAGRQNQPQESADQSDAGKGEGSRAEELGDEAGNGERQPRPQEG